MREPLFNYVGRYFFGSLLLISAVAKLFDPNGFVAVVASYQMMPDWAVPPASYALVLLEGALAIWLFSGRKASLATLCLVCLYVIYCSWVGFAFLDGRRLDNCGAFGTLFERPITAGLVVEYLVSLGVAFFLWSATTAYKLRQQLAITPELGAIPVDDMKPPPPTGTA